MLRKIICIIGLWLVLPSLVFAQSISIGGGQLSPHSKDNGETSLDSGWSMFVSIEKPVYEKGRFSFNPGLMYTYHNYTYNSESKEDSHMMTGYMKSYFSMSDFKPYLMAGLGVEIGDLPDAYFVGGIGLDYEFSKNWSAGVSVVYMESSDRTYRTSGLSVKYNF